MPSDDRLVRRAAQGDRRAFAAIYERYHQELYRFCLTLVREPQDAQDALQNTMLKALRGLEGERREIKLKPWLYRIAHNEAIETIRRRRDGEPLEAEAEIASAAQVGTAVENRYRLRSLLADLEELPDRQRAALVMRELGLRRDRRCLRHLGCGCPADRLRGEAQPEEDGGGSRDALR
jgi:RNA polymerase sigma factor (sigma-70 family)